jgi:hypothetical protein
MIKMAMRANDMGRFQTSFRLISATISMDFPSIPHFSRAGTDEI